IADTAWESALVTSIFAAIFHVSSELAQRAGQPIAPWASRSAVVTPVLAIVLLAAAAAEPSCASPWPWLLGWVALGAMALRQAGFPDREPAHLAVAVVLGLALPAV